jgi:hypothetical protein
MPVVINEFEVVDTPSGSPPESSAAAVLPAPPTLPDEEDLRRLMAEMTERALRLWSH